ncbi:response regulator [Pseudomonas sp. RC10]|uniref:response regulator transcription factor n=1 Tax=Pseudomonas bambusae TaxID=3139142 RepID=UPI00313A0A38
MTLLHAPQRDLVQVRVRPPSPVVYIVDDDISVRESLETLICLEGFEVRSFDCARSFLDCPHKPELGCLLLDNTLPSLTGLELQRSLVIDRPTMPIVFMSGREDASTIVQAMKAGAVEFLTKPLDTTRLLEAVQLAIAKSQLLLAQEQHKNALEQRYKELTRREREVLTRVLRGLLNREIAVELGISEITVKAHRGQVMRKMEARTLADLFRMASDLGF